MQIGFRGLFGLSAVSRTGNDSERRNEGAEDREILISDATFSSANVWVFFPRNQRPGFIAIFRAGLAADAGAAKAQSSSANELTFIER